MHDMRGEFSAIERVTRLLERPADASVWIGDDTAVVDPGRGRLLLAADAVVEGVHADLSLTGLDDLGWKAVVANISDVAAMGGEPGHALVTVAGPESTDLELLYQGIAAAARTYRCPVVGGDLVSSPTLVVTVAVTGWVDGAPVCRNGARAGDTLWVTGALGGAAAGLRLLRSGAARVAAGEGSAGEAGDPVLMVSARIADHARPRAALAEGRAARLGGATAMIDVSDGFGADLGHLADASGVGFELDGLPIADGATLEEALGGGEDYRLVFAAPDADAVAAAFAGLPAPQAIGVCVSDPGHRNLGGRPLGRLGWQHDW
jgi:thiamine-monophosphate kinase